jgi:hypothetical protein
MIFVIVTVIVVGTRATLVAVVVHTAVDVTFSVDVGVGIERQPQAVVSSEQAKPLQPGGAVAQRTGALAVTASAAGSRAKRALAGATPQTAMVETLHHYNVSHTHTKGMEPAIEHTLVPSLSP